MALNGVQIWPGQRGQAVDILRLSQTDKDRVSAQAIENRRLICAFDRRVRKLNKMEKAADKVRCPVYAQSWRGCDRT
jgi:hypothetical protein